MNAQHEPCVVVPRSIYSQMTTGKKPERHCDLVEWLRPHPDVIRWNDQGEYSYKGNDLIKGSDFNRMVEGCLSKTSPRREGPGFQEFYKALADCQVPEECVANRYSKNLLRLYKMIKRKNECKKKWLKL